MELELWHRCSSAWPGPLGNVELSGEGRERENGKEGGLRGGWFAAGGGPERGGRGGALELRQVPGRSWGKVGAWMLWPLCFLSKGLEEASEVGVGLGCCWEW